MTGGEMLNLLAQTDTTGADAAAGAVGLGIVGFVFFIWLAVIVVGLIFFIWWIVLMVDLSKRDFPEKTTWLIIMIVGLLVGLVWLADILYYFMVVRKQGKSQGGSAPAPPAPPTQ